MGHEIFRKPVQQLGMPRGLFHIVDVGDQALAEETLPKPVHNRAWQPPVLAAGDDFGQTRGAFGLVGGGVQRAEIGVEERDLRLLPEWLVALDHLHRTVGVDAREAVGVGEFPVVDEAVVAGGALEVHAHENLRDILRGLDGRELAGVDHAAPDDALGKPFGLGLGMDELGDEAVVGLVRLERREEPLGDLLAATVDVARAAIIVPQKIIPKRQPVLGVTLVVAEKFADELLAFVPAAIGNKGVEFRRLGQEADEIQVSPSRKHPVIHAAAYADLVRLEVGCEQRVDRVLADFRFGQDDLGRVEIPGRLLGEGNPFRPRRALVDPSPQKSDLFGRQLAALLRHDAVRLQSGDEMDEVTITAVAGDGRLAGVRFTEQQRAVVEAEAALVMAAAVALEALLLKDRLDVADEVDRFDGGGRKFGEVFRRNLGPRGGKSGDGENDEQPAFHVLQD